MRTMSKEADTAKLDTSLTSYCGWSEEGREVDEGPDYKDQVRAHPRDGEPDDGRHFCGAGEHTSNKVRKPAVEGQARPVEPTLPIAEAVPFTNGGLEQELQETTRMRNNDESDAKNNNLCVFAIKRGHIYFLLGIAAAIGIFLAGYCGSGACSSGESEGSPPPADDKPPPAATSTSMPQPVTNATESPTASIVTSTPTARFTPIPTPQPTATPRTPTKSPSPTASRNEAIRTYIDSIRISPASTAQEQALQWLINQDPVQLSADAADGRFRLRQRYALLTLWFQLEGPTWKDSSGWLSLEEECAWYGITCEFQDVSGGTVQNAVISLDLEKAGSGAFNNNLQGQIPDDLALLTSLTLLDLSHNTGITGSIPESIWTKLLQLTYLSLDQLSFSGGYELPDSVGNLVNLQEFYIGASSLSGTLPDSIGSMTNMRYFGANSNNLVGPIPATIAQWSNIEYIYLQGNGLTGSLPMELCNFNSIDMVVDCGILCSCCSRCE